LVVALLAPEHGIRGTAEAGVTVGDGVDAKTGVPVYSLYGAQGHRPTPAMLKDVDVLVYDLQEVGGRTWTYVSTMALSMQAAASKGIPFVVLDRPNPIGGEIVEGALLDPAFASFIGMYPIPARHGMTVGELATLFNQQQGIGADLTVVPAQGWRRGQWFDQTGLPWVNPSPNLRSLAAVTSYPGTVYFEGTNLSEGRGTDRPFEQIGAPWLDAAAVAAILAAEAEIIAHVNADHADAVEVIAGGAGWRLSAVDVDGCDMRLEDAIRRLELPAPVSEADGVRKALILAARAARAG
jgi:uncharacterized protein YbbC (DUF1343 family)